MASSMKMLGSCVRCLRVSTKPVKQICSATTSWMQQNRNHTIIMERVFPIPPGKDGGLPNPREVNELHKILRHVEIYCYPREINCILTNIVDGLGIRGDLVSVNRVVFHQELFPAGLAVYASPENIQEFEEERKNKGIEKAESRLGVFARMTIKELGMLTLEIPMSENTSWELTKQHVRVAFRTQGIELNDDSITLPEETITTFQELFVTVWVNGLESVNVQAKVIPISQKYASSTK
uniref:Large ribosomal subunit protein bL9m n=1 Tax=Arion vulgaris TaxID=1028688 RepID=A0A0B6ZY76_9EUPU